MPVLLTCPNGHQWEAPAGADGTTGEWPLRCPTCGAAPQAEPVQPTDAETLPPRAEGNAPEAPTLAPAAGPMPPADQPAVPGYEIQAELGRGGMGVVYKAHHTRLDRLVALKVLPAEAGRDPAFAERFTREARALAKLNHPNIITIYDFGQADGQSYFVMEYVEGSNLRGRVKAGRLPPREALRVAAQVCDALQYAHEAGIVHRDIKPENVLLDGKGRVKIADFGIAKLLTKKATDYTLTGPWQVVGTLHYMAPEQVDNPLGLDGRADLYSLGVMLYEMLTGRLPMGRFAPPSQVVPGDPRVDAIVLRALEREPDKRFQNAAEMLAAIEALGMKPLPARERDEGKTEVQAKAVLDVEPAVTGRQVRWARQRLRLIGSLFLVSGIIGLVPAVVCAVALADLGWPGPGDVGARMSIILGGGLGPLASALVICGGVQMLRHGSYAAALLASIAAMVPLTPCWVFNVWVGLAGLLILLKPEGRAVFPKPAPGHVSPLGRALGNLSAWAVILSALGVVLSLGPWANVQVTDYRGDNWTVARVWGFENGFGIATTVVFLTLLLVHVATGVIGPVPFWRPLLVMAAGLACL